MELSVWVCFEVKKMCLPGYSWEKVDKEKTILNWNYSYRTGLAPCLQYRFSSQGCYEDILGRVKTFLHLKPGKYPSKAHSSSAECSKG